MPHNLLVRVYLRRTEPENTEKKPFVGCYVLAHTLPATESGEHWRTTNTDTGHSWNPGPLPAVGSSPSLSSAPSVSGRWKLSSSTSGCTSSFARASPTPLPIGWFTPPPTPPPDVLIGLNFFFFCGEVAVCDTVAAVVWSFGYRSGRYLFS